MQTKFPNWARPMYGPHTCSICEDPEVFFRFLDTWEEYEDAQLFGESITVHTTCFAMKCYCKECYKEYAGVLDAEGPSSDTAFTESGP